MLLHASRQCGSSQVNRKEIPWFLVCYNSGSRTWQEDSHWFIRGSLNHIEWEGASSDPTDFFVDKLDISILPYSQI